MREKINFLDIPEDERLEFHWALNEAKATDFINLMEEYNVEINSIIEEDILDNFLISAVSDCLGEFKGSENQMTIVKYLIDNGIEVNHKNKYGYTAFDLALAYKDLSEIALLLIRDKNTVVSGDSTVLKAIREYDYAWREEQKELRKSRFDIIEELLKKNGEVSHCSFWIEKINDKNLNELLKKYGYTLESLKEKDAEAEKKYAEEEAAKDTSIDIQHLHNKINNKDYSKTLKIIWQKLVPASGQADTVQGELLRAIEKLRNEAQGNGNWNFSKNCHGLLIKYLKEHLIDKTIFNEEVVDELKNNLKILSKAKSPYTDDDIYENISNRIVDWYLENPTKIQHQKNEKLYC